MKIEDSQEKNNGLINCTFSDNNGQSAVYIAAKEGHFNVVDYLSNSAKADVDKKDCNGNSPVYIAATKEHYPIVREAFKEIKDHFLTSIPQMNPSFKNLSC